MVCWCSCRWWTSWFPWPTRVGTGSWASSESSASCARYAHSGMQSAHTREPLGCKWEASCVMFSMRSQGHKPSAGTETGCGDAHHLSATHRQHRPHLLRFLHHFWHLRSSGRLHSHTHSPILDLTPKIEHFLNCLDLFRKCIW